MIKKSPTKRLALSTETVRELHDGEMRVVGGASALSLCLPPKSVGPYKCPPPPPHQM